MDKLNIIVGNTVDFIVEVDGMSDTPTEAKLELYGSNKYPEGLSDKIIEYAPTSVSNGKIVFTFDSDEIMPTPGSLFGRFFVLDSGKKINAYFKLKFTY